MSTPPSTLLLNGQLKITPPPTADDNSINPVIIAQLLESLGVNQQLEVDYTLSNDSPQAIDLGGMASAQFVMVKVISPVAGQASQPCVMNVTSAAALSAQSVPVDPVAILFCAGTPITALSVTRKTGVLTKIRVVLASA
jgi:hypothetical protein